MQSELFPDIIWRLPPIYIGSAFYKTEEWKRLRYAALCESNGRCQCCGARPSKGNPLHVDHIKPRSKFPWLSLEIENLQVLCSDCNLGKSNEDFTDWRDYDAEVSDEELPP